MTDIPRVLVVDDSALARRKASDPLEAAGFAVDEATDGAQALEAIVADPPEAVLLDYEMPEMDGLEVLETLTERGIVVPVIVLTADDDEETARAFLEAGADDFLTKSTLMGVRVVNAVERAVALSDADPSTVVTPEHPARVLVVDDSPVVRTLIQQTLEQGEIAAEVVGVGDAEEALVLLRKGDWDVLLVDHDLPGQDGPDLLNALHKEGLDVPALALTGSQDPDVALEFLDAGAYDVWTKAEESPLRLVTSVERLAQLNRVTTAGTSRA